MRRLRRFLGLPSRQRWILLEAVLLLSMIHLGLGRVSFTALRTFVTGRPKGRRRAPLDRDLVDRIVWAVTAVGTRLPGLPMCLSRALTVQAMLARRGQPSRLHVGVVRGSEGALEGHAWVECEGSVVIGGTASDVSRFTRLAAFDVDAPGDLQAVTPPGTGR
jgi:hypothetical protein